MPKGRFKHGLCKSQTYVTWCKMLSRCRNKKERYYGKRGIEVCERWHSFEKFLADMGARPPGMSIDRIDTNGNYEPGNCRWATPAQQMRNTRRNRLISINGEELILVDACKKAGINLTTFYGRLALGWAEEKALVAPTTYKFRTRGFSNPLGITYHVLRNRLHRGWDIKKAFITPVRNYSKVVST